MGRPHRDIRHPIMNDIYLIRHTTPACSPKAFVTVRRISIITETFFLKRPRLIRQVLPAGIATVPQQSLTTLRPGWARHLFPGQAISLQDELMGGALRGMGDEELG